ncbi:ABC transporter permease [Methylotuvimicrobium sp. KM2]|uniref:ABC transporter permease n=1 Tax=Methylotuvimicrobium sp. KM2 TaxID=3133976 RepID=UPI00310109AB
MKIQSNNTKIYMARRNGHKTRIWQEMFSDLIASRELIWRLIIRDFSVRYRQSMLGYVWAVLPQIVTVAIFTFLSRHRVFDMGPTDMPYVVHALWSISVWQLFAGCLIGCTNSLVNAGSLVTKINFPKEALVFAAIGQASLDFMIRLIPVTVVFIWYGFVPAWHSVFIPLILIAVLLMALGAGFIMAIINLVLRDMGNMLSMVLTFGMFLAPILYPPPVREPFTIVNVANPFSPLLIATQNLLSGQPLMQPELLVYMIVFSIGVFFLGWRAFHITMPRIAERA